MSQISSVRTPILSILIPTIASRRSLLSRLLWTLEPQLCPEVEVIIHASEKIGMGAKFNELFAMANGRYGVLIDDDDNVVSDYVATILEETGEGDPDYIGYKVLYTVDGRYREVYVSDPRTAVHQPYRLDLILRHVMHKCPILVEKARAHKFGDSYDADYHWVSEMIADGYPHNPVVLDRVLYHYDYWPQYTVGISPKWGPTQREVGNWPYNRSRFTWVRE